MCHHYAHQRLTHCPGSLGLPNDAAAASAPSAVEVPPPPAVPPDPPKNRGGFQGYDIFNTRRREYGVVPRVHIRVSTEEPAYSAPKPEHAATAAASDVRPDGSGADYVAPKPERTATAAVSVMRPDGSVALFANDCHSSGQSSVCTTDENPVQAAVDWGGVDSVVSLATPDPTADVVISHPGLKLIGLGDSTFDLRSLTVERADGFILESVRFSASVTVHHSVGVSRFEHCSVVL